MLFSDTPVGKGSYGVTRHQLRHFIEAGLEQFVVALKKEKAPRGHFINVTNALDHCFKDVLKNETIIEYPIFYIWLEADGLPKDVTTLEEKKLLIAPVVKLEAAAEITAQEDIVSVKEPTVKEESTVKMEAANEIDNVVECLSNEQPIIKEEPVDDDI